MKYCCDKFEEAVKDKHISRSTPCFKDHWLLMKTRYIKYCPFCGKKIRGQGWVNW